MLADEVAVGRARDRFDDSGGLTDELVRSALKQVVRRLAGEAVHA